MPVRVDMNPNVSDTLTLTESVPLGVAPSLPSQSESVSLTESVSAKLSDHKINASDSVAVSESVTGSGGAAVASPADSVAVSESVTLLVTSFVSASESVSVTEGTLDATTIMILDSTPRSVNKSDSVTVSESVTVNTKQC